VDRRFNSQIDADTGFETRAVLCSPVRDKDAEVIGVLQVEREGERERERERERKRERERERER